MTGNQINYWDYLERKRHNVESEKISDEQAKAASKNAETNRLNYNLALQTEPLRAKGSYLSGLATYETMPSVIMLNEGRYSDTTKGKTEWMADRVKNLTKDKNDDQYLGTFRIGDLKQAGQWIKDNLDTNDIITKVVKTNLKIGQAVQKVYTGLTDNAKYWNSLGTIVGGGH